MQYSISFDNPLSGEGKIACDWNCWVGGKWTMSSRERECQWHFEGDLNENGRQEILNHFGLKDIADELPLGKIETMPPAKLAELRRGLEAMQNLGKMSFTSSLICNHVSAELVTA